MLLKHVIPSTNLISTLPLIYKVKNLIVRIHLSRGVWANRIRGSVRILIKCLTSPFHRIKNQFPIY